MYVAIIATKALATGSDYRYYAGMNPASKIIKSLGGAASVARITGVHRTRVYGWMKSRERGGTGGFIPIAHIGKLIAAARQNGIHLSGDDFIPGEAHASAHGATPAPDQGASEMNVSGDAA